MTQSKLTLSEKCSSTSVDGHDVDEHVWLDSVLLPVLTEEVLLGERLGCDGARHPGEVEEVLGVDVLGGDVATP